MLLGVLMTSEAASACLLGGRILERENLALVSAAIDMFFSRTVAGFTTVPLWPFSSFEFPLHRCDEMRGSLKMVVDVFVAGLACVRADVQVWIAGQKRLLWRRFSLIRGPLVL